MIEKPIKNLQNNLRGCDHRYILPTAFSQKSAGATNEITTAVVPPKSPNKAALDNNTCTTQNQANALLHMQYVELQSVTNWSTASP